MGPWSAGSAATLLLGEVVAENEIEGGPAAFAQALEKVGLQNGVEFQTGTTVERVLLDGRGDVKGVRSSSGEAIEARCVLSTIDPKQTIEGFFDAQSIPPSLAREARVWRQRGTTAKVCLALSGALEFDANPAGERIEAARTGESLDDVERAFDAVKYGMFSQAPQLDIRVPSVSDASVAPTDHHVVSILVHFAPYDLDGGWSDERRDALGDVVVDTLSGYSSTVRERIVAREVLTPRDLETRYGLSGGHIHHGEHALDQLLSLRPSKSCANYGTPIDGLFLGGSGSHPGGGITGVPGALAAKTIIAWKRS